MNKEKINKHIKNLLKWISSNPDQFKEEVDERVVMRNSYSNFNMNRLLEISEDELYRYLSSLWAMRIWGNKQYAVNKIINDNGIVNLRENLSKLIWGIDNISKRWDSFRSNIKGIGPAMISELLCKTHPKDFMLWNRRAYIALQYLEVDKLPRYDYQLTGKVYEHLCKSCLEVSKYFKDHGIDDDDLLAVDYFFYRELQFVENLSKIDSKPSVEELKTIETKDVSKFIHNEVRDKVRDIGLLLGFDAETEKKVADGSKVDTIWEVTIGNMGRVIYVFEVQTKGSIDSLILTC